MVPHLGAIAWCIVYWLLTLLGFISILALVYVTIISTFNQVGGGVDKALTLLAANINRLGDQV